MGLCFSTKSVALVKKQSSRSFTQPESSSSNSGDGEVGGNSDNNNNNVNIWGNSRLSRREEARIHEKALATALLLQKQLRSGSVRGGGGGPFDRSASVRNNNGNLKKNQNLPRTTSSRPRSLTDPPVQPQQLVNEKPDLDDIETAHFVLVHGGGFGAWCWYKSIALLQDTGYKVTAIDLIGSGIDSLDTNSITSLAQYVKPLTDFLANLADDEDKVILVGHDFGGACISYAMELFPSRISKAVFVAATMLTSGQSALDMFSQQEESNDLMQQAQIFVYAKGNDNPPTAIDLNKTLLKDLFFNNSPTKDVALASVSMRPIPFSPLLEKLSLSDVKYGSVRRFYIHTSEDNAIPFSLQESMISKSQPEQVFCLKGADHSPFFSKPQALHKLLAEISEIP